jgi:CBS domain containing-hemolysin-like protein
MEEISNVLIVAVIFATLYGVTRLIIRRKERLTMIEKGSVMPEMKDENFSFSTLKFGTLFTGIGLGVLVANILTVSTDLDKEVAYFSMVFLFGGISLIITHLIERKKMVK